MVGVLLGPWPALTNRALTVERNRLLLSFGVLIAVNLALGSTFHFRLPWEKWAGYGPLVLAGAKLLYTLAVYHAARVLRQPGWLTAVYVALAPLAGFELVPLVGLLAGVRMARGTLEDLRV
jgi:hypothetical protein